MEDASFLCQHAQTLLEVTEMIEQATTKLVSHAIIENKLHIRPEHPKQVKTEKRITNRARHTMQTGSQKESYIHG